MIVGFLNTDSLGRNFRFVFDRRSTRYFFKGRIKSTLTFKTYFNTYYLPYYRLPNFRFLVMLMLFRFEAGSHTYIYIY